MGKEIISIPEDELRTHLLYHYIGKKFCNIKNEDEEAVYAALGINPTLVKEYVERTIKHLKKPT